MNNRKTVFVLGAGASVPYDFPSGSRLSDILCESNDGFAYKVATEAGSDSEYSISDLNRFLRQFRNSGRSSIDAFLSNHPNFVDVGKFLIAHILCRYEVESNLYSTSNADRWYHYLWNEMVGVSQAAQDLPYNRVRFVTFNYDRSLEHFLFNALRSSFGLNEQVALEALARFDIRHVYGQLGEYHFMPESANAKALSRRYMPAQSLAEVKVAAASIRIVPEDRESPVFPEIRKWFDWADQICFLGFGFDPLNVERLGLIDVIASKPNPGLFPHVFFSALKRTEMEISHIKKSLSPGGQLCRAYDDNCVMTLRESACLL